MLGLPVFKGHGFGLGVAVVMDPAEFHALATEIVGSRPARSS